MSEAHTWQKGYLWAGGIFPSTEVIDQGQDQNCHIVINIIPGNLSKRGTLGGNNMVAVLGLLLTFKNINPASSKNRER